MIINELITQWGFKVDANKVAELDKKLDATKRKADETGDSIEKVGRKGKLKTASFYNIDSKMGKDGRWRDPTGRFLPMGGGAGGSGGGSGGGGLLASLFGKGGASALDQYKSGIDAIKESAASARNSILAMGAAFSVGAIGVGGLFRLIGSMEQTEIAFETMIGDADKAKKTLADLQNFAKNTPFDFAGTADLSKRLLAFSFQAEELIPIMTSLGNIAAGVGKEKLPQLVLALGQVKAAGKLRGSELRQFTEAGVPLIAELAKTLGVADSQVQQMVESGSVGFDMVWKSLQRVTGEGGRFNNLMAKQSQSLLGRFSNLTDTLQLMAVDLGKRGLLGKAKEYLESFMNILETNREQILDGAQHAIELTIIGLQKIINIARGVWNVFRGLTQAVGGVRKALDLMIRGLAIVTSARLLFLLGKFVLGIGSIARAWAVAGNAAFLAQIKMAAIPIAIGAAVVALGLIIEDVVAYFQGRKSVTGLLLADLDKIGDRLEQFIAPVIEKVKGFAKNIGVWIMDGLAALTDANWGAIGNGLLKAFEIIGLLTTIPLRIGLAIAQGVIEGLVTGLKSRFPKIAGFLGLDDQPLPSMLPKPGEANFKTDTGVLSGIWDVMKMVGGSMSLKNYNPIPGSGLQNLIDQKRAQQAAGGVTIDAPVTITVPEGTPPEQVGPRVESGIQKAFEGKLRDAAKANKPMVSY